MAYHSALTALADPTRRRVFERLRAGPRAVGDLAKGLPVSRPAVSQHLRVLEDAGLVRAERRGRQRLYRIEREGLAGIRTYIEGFWKDVLEAYRDAAERGREEPG